jgi:hypothetical protein
MDKSFEDSDCPTFANSAKMGPFRRHPGRTLTDGIITIEIVSPPKRKPKCVKFAKTTNTTTRSTQDAVLSMC